MQHLLHTALGDKVITNLRTQLLYLYIPKKCASCGKKSNSSKSGKLQFHHIDPAKKQANIFELTENPHSAKLLKEIQKCCRLCQTCHTHVHTSTSSPTFTPIKFPISVHIQSRMFDVMNLIYRIIKNQTSKTIQKEQQ